MQLRLAPHGTLLRVRHIEGSPALARELLSFGLRPGCEFSISQRAAGDGLVLCLGADRIAVDHRACAAIDVDVMTSGLVPATTGGAA